MTAALLSRRRLFRGAPAALSLAALPAAMAATPDESDVELLRLGVEFDQLHTHWLQIHAEMTPVFDAFDTELKRRIGELPFMELYRLVDAETGYEAASIRNNDALDAAGDLATVIRGIPAQTLAGFAVKARLLAFDCGFSRWLDEPEADMDWDVQCFLGFLREFEGLAPAVQS